MPLFNTIIDFVPLSMLDLDGTLVNDSDVRLPSQKATKTYVDGTSIARIYRSGTLKTSPKMYTGTAIVASGAITFYITSNGISTGSAVFSNVYKESLNWWLDDANNQYQVGGYTLSGDKKSITLTVNRLGSVLIGIIQLITAANGATLNLSVWGD